MTKQKPNNKDDDSSSGDSSDSEEENITMVVDTPDNNNDDKTKEEKENEKKRKEGEKKKKRKQRFEDEERKNKNRRKIDPKNPPIIISFFDLINGSRNLENEGWNSVNSSEQECSCPPSPPPREHKKDIVDDILQEPLNSEYLDLHLETIDDLIKVGKDYSDGVYSPLVRYNINVYKLSKLIGPLEKLKNMIGMENIKRDIFELLLYQLQDFDNSKDMLHTIIEGEPGVGKTDLAKIIANIYQEMGYCTNELVKFVKS